MWVLESITTRLLSGRLWQEVIGWNVELHERVVEPHLVLEILDEADTGDNKWALYDS